MAFSSAATRRIAGGAVALGTLGFIGQTALFNVDAGHRAFIFDRYKGCRVTEYDEGTHFLIPILQFPIVYDMRTRPRSITTMTGTRDLQTVNISLRVLSHPEKSHLIDIYQSIGLNWDERVLPSIVNEVLKSVVAQYNADQLLMMRDKISEQIRENLTERASDFHILLDDVSITHLTFSKEFTKAIEQKQVAEQIAERAKFVVLRSEQEKKAAVIRAEGESEAALLISEALKDSGNGLIQLRRIEAARDIAGTLARGRNVTYLPGKGNVLLNLPTSV
eukprot:269141_1